MARIWWWRFVRTFPTMTMLAGSPPLALSMVCHTDMTTLLPCSGYQLKPHLNFTARIPLPLTRLAIYWVLPMSAASQRKAIPRPTPLVSVIIAKGFSTRS